MKKFLVITILAIPVISFSQEAVSAKQEEDKVYIDVDEPASFSGGIDGFYKFLSKNLRYPKKAQRMRIQGKVYYEFIVEKDGSLTNAKIIQGLGGGCDEEVLRLIEIMPNWIPGKINEESVRQVVMGNILFKFP